jgi:hypothetical protein
VSDSESDYIVHASITTDLHKISALTEAGALGKWLSGENFTGRLIAGRIRQEPFRHLEARIATDSPVEQVVHVALERELEAREGRWPT